MQRAAAAIFAAALAGLVASPAGVDARVERGSGLATKKEPAPAVADHEPPLLLATLVQTHTDERVPLDGERLSLDEEGTQRVEGLP